MTVAADGSEDWGAVLALRMGQTVRVETREGRTRGKITSVDAEAMTLSVSGHSVSIDRAAIIQVAEIGERQIGRDMGRGLLIGAVIGAVWWAIAAKDREKGAVYGAAFGALDGAIVGGLVGIGDRPERVVYEATHQAK